MSARVLVTCPPMLGLIDEFRPTFKQKGVELSAPQVVQTMSEDELVELLPAFDGWIIGDDPATARVFEAGTGGALKAAVKWGVGVDNVDFAAAKRLGLKITNTPSVFGREVADVAINYVTGLARETFRIDREIRMDFAWPKPAGISTWDKTAAIIGFGDIGRQTARRLLACDMNVTVYDPFYKADPTIAVTHRSWPDGVEDADFLVFTCPLTPDTRGMFNDALLERLKPGVRVVNVARGPVVDERAL
ncbi:MAG: NAD(P)-dependent oxidoreductase, partial [Maricaulaceae bacterium]